MRKRSPSSRSRSILRRVTLSASASFSLCGLKRRPLMPMTRMPGARPARSPGIPGTTSVIVAVVAEREAERVPGRDARAASALLGRRGFGPYWSR